MRHKAGNASPRTALVLGILMILAAGVGRDDYLAEPAGLRRAGSGLPVATGVRVSLGARKRRRCAERYDCRRRLYAARNV